jgi:hypothetical protein
VSTPRRRALPTRGVERPKDAIFGKKTLKKRVWERSFFSERMVPNNVAPAGKLSNSYFQLQIRNAFLIFNLGDQIGQNFTILGKLFYNIGPNHI